MLFNNAQDIVNNSYSKLGDLTILRMRNHANGYDRSQSQKNLYTQSQIIRLNLGSLLDHLSFDDNGNIISALRSTDEQINRFLKTLESIVGNENFSTAPTLFRKRYILVKSKTTVVSNLVAGSWVTQGNWNGSSNVFPTSGKLGDSIKEGYTWDNILASTTLLKDDGGIIPAGALIRAAVDNPGQTLANWKISIA